MFRHGLVKKFGFSEKFLLSLRHKTTSSINVDALEEESTQEISVIDEEAQRREEEIELKRNKSRLRPADRNFIQEQNPYPESTRWHHGTMKYMRRLYGRYGAESGIDPQICWPIKEELDESKEYEQVKYPFTIPEMMATAKQLQFEKNEKIRLRQEDIAKKVEKIEMWERELHNKMAKKENEALAAKARRERLLEEVRMHFGYTVDPKDEKFKEMLEKKEKEQKKVAKEARKKQREQNLLNKMLSTKTNDKDKGKSIPKVEEP